MRGRAYDVAVRKRIRVFARDDEPGDMRYVGEKKRAHAISDLSKFSKIYLARIGACAANDHLRFYDLSDLKHLIVVYATVKLHAVFEAIIHLSAA